MSAQNSNSMGEPSALPRRLSPRDLSDYRVCPRRVWCRRVARVRLPARPAPTLALGNAVHQALFLFFGLAPNDRDPEEGTLHQCLRAAWKYVRSDAVFASRDEEASYGRRGLAMLSVFAEQFDTTVAPVGREQWVSTRLPNGVELFGKVDRLDGDSRPDSSALHVVDYKTGRVPTDNDMADDPAAQVYLLGSESEYGREVERVRFIYLADGTESRWEPEREDVSELRDRLTELTDVMTADREFEARPGTHCSRCEFAKACPDAGRVNRSDLEVADAVVF